jgi:hypothetical protein
MSALRSIEADSSRTALAVNMQMQTSPNNAVPWTEADDAKLSVMREAGIKVAEGIAKELGVTQASCEARWYRIKRICIAMKAPRA